MARKNSISAFSLYDNQDMSAASISEETNIRNLDVATIRVSWTGSPVGVLTVEALQQKDTTPEESREWFELDLGSEIIIDSAEIDHQIVFNKLPFDQIRLKYVPMSGTGTLNARITAKQVGG